MTAVASALKRTVAVLTLLLAAVMPARAEIIDRIMAVVGGPPITLSDVNVARVFGLVEGAPGSTDPVVFVLDRLIDRHLMLAEVDRFQPPEPAPVEVTLRIEEIEQRMGSPDAFARALTVTGATREQLRRYVRDDLRTATYLNQRFGANPEIAERATAIAAWTTELRRRAEITLQYKAQ